MSHQDHSLPSDVGALQTLLQQQRSALAEQQEQLAQQAELIAQQHAAIAQQQQALDRMEHRLAQLLKRQYGPRRERITPDQLLLFTQEELDQLANELQQDSEETNENTQDIDAEPPRKKRRRGGRRPLPASLPREQVVYELKPEERPCPCCGESRAEIGSAASEQLEFIPSQLRVIEHIRKKYACRRCGEQVTIAAKAPQPIEKGLPGPGLLAHTVLSKYGDHLPLYRQEDILARHGVVLRRSTLCDWIAAAAELARPLWLLMRREVLLSRVIHTDDTTVRMLAPDKTRTARLWAYIGDAAHPHSVYDFTESRNRDGPSRFMADFKGYLQADAYGGICAGGQVHEVACWAHARRYWLDAQRTDPRRALEALSYIGRLYKLEEQFREANLMADALRDARKKHADPILDALEQWLAAPEQNRVLPKSPIGAARNYTIHQWKALRRYTEEGCLAIDNNLSERTVKIAAIGRKNWLFVGSRLGGERAAILCSLVASCKANGVEPLAYLTDLFKTLPLLDASDDAALQKFLPDRWLAAHPEHAWKIDQLRQQERKRTRQARFAKRKK